MFAWKDEKQIKKSMKEREKQREGEIERERDKEREREGERQGEREREMESESQYRFSLHQWCFSRSFTHTKYSITLYTNIPMYYFLKTTLMYMANNFLR